MPLRKVLACIAAGLIGMGPAVALGAEANERPLTLETFPAPVHGTLLLPAGSGPFPGVLILGGSGPVDRDGNAPGGHNDHLKLLAQGLATHGIATLRIDKRGVGESAAAAPDESKLRFHSYVSDAVHWLDRLRAEPPIDHVYILGHSEGALVATLAAQQVHPDGLILVAGSGVPAGVALRRQIDAAGVSPAVREAAERILTSLEHQKPVADVEPTLAPLFRPSVQPYVMSWLPIDPATELAKVSAPTLVVQGTTDIQITMDDAHTLAAARPGIKLVEIKGMNHVLKVAPADRAANIAAYNDPKLPLAPTLVPTIAAFIARR